MEANQGFARIKPTRKSGDEPFFQNKQPLELKLADFWRWSASDLVSNATRGILAEYIVACALGLADAVRNEWDAFDLLTPSGKRIEVKSSAYLQSWFHEKPSVIEFSIRPSYNWDADANKIVAERKRQADIYVFCLLNRKEKDSLDPLNLDQWEFYILPAAVLDAEMPTQKKARLPSLLKLNPHKVNFEGLAGCIQSLDDR